MRASGAAFESSSLDATSKRLALGGVILLASGRVEDYLADLVGTWSRKTVGMSCSRLSALTRAFLLNAKLGPVYRKTALIDDESALLGDVASHLMSGDFDITLGVHNNSFF